MAHFGLLCPPTAGHINPMSTLGRALRARGHRVTMFQLPDLRASIEREHLDFWPLGNGDATAGELSAALEQLGHLTGLAALRFTIRCAARLARVVLDYAPTALREAKIDAAVIDQNEPAGATVAEYLGLPFVSLAPLPLNREPDIPPPFVPWRYEEGTRARVRNKIGYAVADTLLTPVTDILNRRRAEWGLPSLTSPDDSFSRIAQLCMLPRALDFPRRELPAWFHYLGPFIDDRRSSALFPWEQLDGRPLVYASFGTILNRRQEWFRTVAEACARLDVQLVLSAGGGEICADGIAGSPIVVSYAPQLELLARASFAITHAGLNTVLESLHCGVPMIAIPVTNDQPAVASRLQRAGVGEVIPLNHLSTHRLRAAIERVLADKTYRRQAHKLKEEIQAAGGVQRAVDIIEQQLNVRRLESPPKYRAANLGGGAS